MSNNFKFSYVNIDKEALAEELGKRGSYYANVVMWSILFSFPLFVLLDFLFFREEWVLLLLVRTIFTLVSYTIYILGIKKSWNYIYTMRVFANTNVILQSVICGFIPFNIALPYFLMFSILILLFNSTVFWKPIHSILICLLSYLIIVIIYSNKDRVDKYNLLISHGGAVYFLVSAFSCMIVYNRYQILKREVAKNIMIDEANNRLLDQNEKINDQRYVIEDANRKLKILNDYRHNTLNIMLHDFRNFTGSIEMSLDLLKNKSDNLSGEQKEILNYIGVGNEKLKYLSEKLADSADKDEAKVQFNYEYFDVGPEVENSTIEITDAAQIKQVNLQLHLSPSAIMVHLDKLFFAQVLFKLFTNAIKYAQSGSVMTIHTHEMNGKCVIEIVNIGKLVGMDKLNELFNKLKTSKQLAEAMNSETNMGFAIAKKLTETMGGTLTYNSSEGTGNYYRIEFKSTH